MDVFSILSLASFLNDNKKGRRQRKVSWMEQDIYELSSDLDYYLNMIRRYGKRFR